MGFEQLKSKLAGKEEGYAVNDENIQEWINMPSDQKKSLIAEAKEKGGVWRESLLKIDEAAKEELRTGPRGPRATSRADTPPPVTLDNDAENAPKATLFQKAGAKGQEYYDKLAKAGIKAGEHVGAHKAEYGAGTAAALAAGLGAVALAKKMRGAKKK